ncbi:MAG TPA: sigma-70 family RNA polymerase sigma factor, partial [Puia sp.]|nr:sigma-70 family RNA polymerase sigma factor [Puia sp.]
MYTKEEFVRIIKENEGLIYKIVRVYTSGREDEEDLYQEIIYQLWKSFPSFRNEAKISTWMYRIALNTSIAHLNKEKKRGSLIPINEHMLNMPDMEDNLKNERMESMYTHIKKLNPVEKGIILLHLEGNNYNEIANITGFTST